MQPITKEACTLQQLVQKRLSGFINCDHNNAQIVLLRAQLLNWLMAVIYTLYKEGAAAPSTLTTTLPFSFELSRHLYMAHKYALNHLQKMGTHCTWVFQIEILLSSFWNLIDWCKLGASSSLQNKNGNYARTRNRRIITIIGVPLSWKIEIQLEPTLFNLSQA